MIDGKTDINGSSLLFIELHICDSFLWRSYVDPGTTEKDTAYISKVINEAYKSNNTKGSKPLCQFDSTIFSTMMDNAFVCSVAGDICEKQFSLVKLNCCIHTLALFPTHIFTKIDLFQTTLSQVELLISLFRKKGRVQQILKAECKTKNQVLLRIIPDKIVLSSLTLKTNS